MSGFGGRRRPKEVRPTSGKVLGALFSILGDLRGKSFLDLFSGTGRVALDAWKRGAKPVVAVELLPPRARDIRALLPDEPEAFVLAMDVRRAFSLLRRKAALFQIGSGGFDIIFADPPYGAGWPAILGEMLFPPEGGLLHSGGLVVIEHSVREEIVPGAGCRLFDRREYGETSLSFLAPAALPGEGFEERGEEE